MGSPAWKQWRIGHLALAITFLTSGVFINLIQGILYYLIRPLNKQLFRRLNFYVSYSLYLHIIFFAQWWGDVRLTVHIDKDEFKKYYGREHGYLIFNHTYEIDWVVGWILCDSVGILGNCKTYGKKSIQYIPTMGLAWKFGESIFLERNWEKDKEVIGRQIRELVSYEDPILLMLMAEGTRFTKEKHEASMIFAKEKGLPILKHHLTPRTRGFISSLPSLRGKVPAVYNVVMGIRGGQVAPTMLNVLLGKKIEASMFMERIPLETVPEGDAEAAAWLHRLYEKKDKLLDSYLKTGDFFSQSGVPNVPGFPLKPRISSLLNTVCWAIVVLVPAVMYLISLVCNGSFIAVAICLLITFSFLYMLNKLLKQTQISSGSSYGASAPSSPVN